MVDTSEAGDVGETVEGGGGRGPFVKEGCIDEVLFEWEYALSEAVVGTRERKVL